LAKSIKDKQAAGVTSRRFVQKPVLSSALLTASLATALLATLLAAALLTLPLLTFAFFSAAILLLSALLSGGRGFARFIWILLCVHHAFLSY
jgi:hypothetical protein